MPRRHYVLRCPYCGAVIDYEEDELRLLNVLEKVFPSPYIKIWCDKCKISFGVDIERYMLKKGKIVC